MNCLKSIPVLLIGVLTLSFCENTERKLGFGDGRDNYLGAWKLDSSDYIITFKKVNDSLKLFTNTPMLKESWSGSKGFQTFFENNKGVKVRVEEYCEEGFPTCKWDAWSQDFEIKYLANRNQLKLSEVVDSLENNKSVRKKELVGLFSKIDK